MCCPLMPDSTAPWQGCLQERQPVAAGNAVQTHSRHHTDADGSSFDAVRGEGEPVTSPEMSLPAQWPEIAGHALGRDEGHYSLVAAPAVEGGGSSSRRTVTSEDDDPFDRPLHRIVSEVSWSDAAEHQLWHTGRARDAYHGRPASPQTPTRMIQNWEEIVTKFRALCKSRSQWSYRSLLHREQWKYVRQKQNQVADLLARLQQQLEHLAEPLALTDGRGKMVDLLEAVRLANVETGQAEDALESTTDAMVEAEAEVKRQEDHLRSLLVPEDSPAGLTLSDDVLETLSLPARISPAISLSGKSYSGAVHVDIRLSPPARHMLQDALYTSLLDPSGLIDISTFLDQQSSVGSDSTISTAFGEDRLLHGHDHLEVPRVHVNSDAEVTMVGFQFSASLSPFPTSETSNDNLLAVTSCERRKREFDHGEILADSVAISEDGRPADHEPPTGTRDEVQASYHKQVEKFWDIHRVSWMDFTRFLRYVEDFVREQGKTFKFLKSLDLIAIDRVLGRVQCARRSHDAFLPDAEPASVSARSTRRAMAHQRSSASFPTPIFSYNSMAGLVLEDSTLPGLYLTPDNIVQEESIALHRAAWPLPTLLSHKTSQAVEDLNASGVDTLMLNSHKMNNQDEDIQDGNTQDENTRDVDTMEMVLRDKMSRNQDSQSNFFASTQPNDDGSQSDIMVDSLHLAVDATSESVFYVQHHEPPTRYSVSDIEMSQLDTACAEIPIATGPRSDPGKITNPAFLDVPNLVRRSSTT